MINITTFLQDREIPTHSLTRAVQHMNATGYAVRSLADYDDMIYDLTGQHLNTKDEVLARFTFFYVVQTAYCKPELSGEEVFNIADSSAATYVKNNAWVAGAIDADFEPKAKKGGKKEHAQKLWAERKNDNLSRKAWIELLVAEVGLTSAGASTYYSNMKAGRF